MTKRILSLLLLLAVLLAAFAACTPKQGTGNTTSEQPSDAETEEKASEASNTESETRSESERPVESASATNEAESEGMTEPESTAESMTDTTGETGEAETDGLFTERILPFSNHSVEYDVKSTSVSLYFKDGGSVPYIALPTFISMLDGFLLSEEYAVSTSEDTQSVTLTVTVVMDEDGTLTEEHTLCFNADTDRIDASILELFSVVADTMESDYEKFIDTFSSEYTHGDAVSLPLGKYGIEMFFYDGTCVLPLYVLNMLFCSPNLYNVYYNGSELIGVDLYADEAADSDTYALIYDTDIKGTDAPADVREASVSATLFALDYLYGLKEFSGIQSYRDVLDDALIKDMSSVKESVFAESYVELFHRLLDEMHTSILTPSYYSSSGDPFAHSVDMPYGEHMYEYLIAYFTYGSYIEQGYREIPASTLPISYDGNTAVIFLEEFKTGKDSDLYDENGNLKETAWQYDSYCLMQAAMAEIEKNPAITNVALDLSLNSGGNVGAMLRVLGFLTDEAIPLIAENALSGSLEISYSVIDTDGDGIYENDAYDTYEWFILTSPVTFSAANYFSFTSKYMGIATLIGEQTGGGMCAITPILLPDGTSASISSNYCLMVMNEGGELIGTEGGVTPDFSCDATGFYQSDTSAAYYVSYVARYMP